MHLLAPESSLLLWTLICLIALLALIAAAIGLMYSNKMSTQLKWTWLLLVIIVPIVGPILFFYFRKKKM